MIKRVFKKLFDELIYTLKDSYREIIFCFCFVVLFTYPLPFYILTSGGTLNVENKVIIDGEYSSEGSFNLAYVNQMRGTLPTYIIAKFNKDWTMYTMEEYTGSKDEGSDVVDFRDEIELLDSQQMAVKVAYDKAGKSFIVKENYFYVYWVEEDVKKSADIKTGDKIISINGKKVTTKEDYTDETAKTELGDTVSVVLERNGKEHTVKLKVYELDNRHITGVVLTPKMTYETDPKIKFKFKESEGGSSGGLMLSLSIYNKLIEEDITHGLKIVGTGTIDASGNVGPIGGVKYKLKGAVKDKADVFIVPRSINYDEVKEIMDKKHYNIKIIAVDTFEEALEELEKLGD